MYRNVSTCWIKHPKLIGPAYAAVLPVWRSARMPGPPLDPVADHKWLLATLYIILGSVSFLACSLTLVILVKEPVINITYAELCCLD